MYGVHARICTFQKMCTRTTFYMSISSLSISPLICSDVMYKYTMCKIKVYECPLHIHVHHTHTCINTTNTAAAAVLTLPVSAAAEGRSRRQYFECAYRFVMFVKLLRPHQRHSRGRPTWCFAHRCARRCGLLVYGLPHTRHWYCKTQQT